MEFEISGPEILDSPISIKNPDLKVKSPIRMRYEAEVLLLKKQNGGLEDIRQKLGLSRRKICQLLLVDPSAWTRWTAPGSDAPPHMYQALDWYVSIMEKDPEYRRLATRFASWLTREKEYESRLSRIETKVLPAGAFYETESSAISRRRSDWRDIVIPILAFLTGGFLVYFW